MARLTCLTALSLLLLPHATVAMDTRHNLQLTVYDSNLALIQEQRDTYLKKGLQWLSLDQVSDQLIPQSLRLDLPGNAHVVQQSFHHDPITRQRLLELHIGKTIEIRRTNAGNGKPSQREVTLLAHEGRLVTVRDQGKISSLVIDNDIEFLFPSLPPSLTTQPELRAQVRSTTAHNGKLGLRYLSTGLNWAAQYDLNLNVDGSEGQLSCWVNLTNSTRSHWDNAHIELVAGQLNRAPVQNNRMLSRQVMMMSDSIQAAPKASQRKLGDYYLYTLPTLLSLNPGEQKQVQLFSQSTVAITKHYRLDFNAGGGLYQRQFNPNTGFTHASVSLALANQTQSEQALPGGLWRVFSSDKNNKSRLLGEDRAGHTPHNQHVILKLGKAFDVTGKRVQTHFKRVDKKETVSDWEVVLKNASKKATHIEVNERLGQNWSITKQSHPHKRLDAQRAQWNILVPAQSEVTLTYRVRVRQR